MKNGLMIDEYGNRWYKDDQYHREDGPAIERCNGDKVWYKDNLIHREGGPAIAYFDGNKCWYQNGLLHRIDGPAAEYSDESKAWYFQGKQIKCSSQDEFERIIKLKAFW